MDKYKEVVAHPDWKMDKVTYHSTVFNTGSELQVDHILPISHGGDGIGLKNIQVLCAGCHKRKTKEERKFMPVDI